MSSLIILLVIGFVLFSQLDSEKQTSIFGKVTSLTDKLRLKKDG